MSKNTPEYAAIKKANHKLLKAVQNNVIALGAALFAEDLITDDNYTSLKNETRSEVNRAAELVGYVMNKIEQSPENYHIFVKLLIEEGGTYKEVLKILELIYRDPDAKDDLAGAVVQAQPIISVRNGTQPGTISIRTYLLLFEPNVNSYSHRFSFEVAGGGILCPDSLSKKSLVNRILNFGSICQDLGDPIRLQNSVYIYITGFMQEHIRTKNKRKSV